MRRLLQTLAGITTCAAVVIAGFVVATALASQGEVSSRATTFGEVGAFRFQDRQRAPGAECKYNKQGRLTKIALRAPRVAGRQEWEPSGHWVLWAARLQTKTRQGGWKSAGENHYSEAEVRHSGSLRALPPTSIPRIFGAANKQYRVVETIYWYTHNTNVQGRASAVVQHYESRGGHARSCDGVAGPLPVLDLIKNEELDAVNLSFARRSRGADVTYSVRRGTLPQGLSLNTDRGVVSGSISAGAVRRTVNYRNINSRTFRFVLAARANGRTTTRSYRWKVYDTAFVMPNYYGYYGCNGDPGCSEPVPNISSLGQKFAFGCTTEPQPGIPADRYSVIYQQDYQKADGSLAPSAGLTFRYGDVFKWWYYNVSC